MTKKQYYNIVAIVFLFILGTTVYVIANSARKSPAQFETAAEQSSEDSTGLQNISAQPADTLGEVDCKDSTKKPVSECPKESESDQKNDSTSPASESSTTQSKHPKSHRHLRDRLTKLISLLTESHTKKSVPSDTPTH